MFDKIKNIFRRNSRPSGEKASRTAGIGVIAPGGAVWSDRNYENFAKEAYMKNVIAFACIDRIAKATATVPWEVYTRMADGTATDNRAHPFNEVLKRANPETSWTMAIYGLMSYLCMAGNAYVEGISPGSADNFDPDNVKEIWNLRPDRIAVTVDEETGTKTGYVYTVSGKDILFPIDPLTGNCSLLHIKLFHPLDDFYGLSPIEPAARKIDASNSMDAWNKSLMDNSGRMGLLFIAKEPLTDNQYERLKQQIRDNIDGPKNAGKTHILENFSDVRPYGFSPSEMDWIKSNLELARSICLAWGVPPQLIGLPDASTYSNYQEARAAFYEDTILFYLMLLRSSFNAWLFTDENTFLDFELDDVPAMQFKRDLKWKHAQESDFLTTNEKRDLVGLENIDGGDVVLVPATMIPLGESPSGSESPPEDDPTNEEAAAHEQFLRMGFSDDEIAELVAGDRF